ncbi:hypothetical protein ES319_D01G180200v1 [Gossypium barbadense]|uniref:Uncharacterized protein n=2 Tax=Gossypium TaxID=3633 RepID=A0A5J5SQ01_GOSBA|nr:hypothetical protein ES319_D01G180200v1 [Gossypium barbadense]
MLLGTALRSRRFGDNYNVHGLANLKICVFWIGLPGSLKISGLVIQGANGRVLGSRTVLNDNIPSVFTAEALTCI